MEITREAQDQFAIESYKRALNATKSGYFDNEIITIKNIDRKGNVDIIDKDEELARVNFDKIPSLTSFPKRRFRYCCKCLKY